MSAERERQVKADQRDADENVAGMESDIWDAVMKEDQQVATVELDCNITYWL